MQTCKQCHGRSYLRIADPMFPSGYSINLYQCLLCLDQKKYDYVLQYYKETGMTPPDNEVFAVHNEGAKILVMKRNDKNETYFDDPNMA